MNVSLSKAGRFRSTKLAPLVVIALIFTLSTMGCAQYRDSVVATKESVLKTDLLRMLDAIHQYFEHLPKEGQRAIKAIVGEPVPLVEYDEDGRAKLEFEDPFTGRPGTLDCTTAP